MVAIDNSIAVQVDKSLSSGPFGNGNSLSRNIRTLYTGIQRIIDALIGINVTSGMFSSSAAAQVITRAVLDETFVMIKNNNLEGARQELDALRQHFNSLANDQSESVTHIFPELDLRPLENWKSNNYFHKAIASRIRDSFVKDGITGEVEFVEPTKSHDKAIENGKALLNQLIPGTSSSTLSLVRCLSIVKAAFQSAYFNETPFMYVVSVTKLNDPLQTADTILHEALHQKMVDIRLTRQILCEEYDDIDSRDSADVPIPWGASSPRPYSVARGLATYHFYVHSTLVHAAALEHLHNNAALQNIGAEEIACRLLSVFERAVYLETSLKSDVARKKIGSDGISFMEWMSHAMNRLREVRLLDGTKLGEQQLKYSDNTAQI